MVEGGKRTAPARQEAQAQEAVSYPASSIAGSASQSAGNPTISASLNHRRRCIADVPSDQKSRPSPMPRSNAIAAPRAAERRSTSHRDTGTMPLAVRIATEMCQTGRPPAKSLAHLFTESKVDIPPARRK